MRAIWRVRSRSMSTVSGTASRASAGLAWSTVKVLEQHTPGNTQGLAKSSAPSIPRKIRAPRRSRD